ncbi:hypothetical protein Tco_0538926, partial [Tanacetum coccineum]
MNPRHQPPEQNLEECTETGIPEAHHRTPVYSKDLRRTDPLHRSPGHGKKEACLIDGESTEIHNIKQRDGESTEDFMERYKAEVLDVEGA